LDRICTKSDCSNLQKMPTISLQMVDHQGNTVDYPLEPKEYTLRSLEEVPNTGDTDHFNEFPLLGVGGVAPDVQPHCEPGIGVMDVPGKKWVIGDTFLRRYYSIYDDDRGLVGFVRSVHPDEAPAAPSSQPTVVAEGGEVAARGSEEEAATIASSKMAASPGPATFLLMPASDRAQRGCGGSARFQSHRWRGARFL